MEPKFIIAVGPHAPQMAIRAEGLTVRECHIVRRCVTNQWMNTQDYRLSRACGAFLQGYDEKTGYVLVEFWAENREAMEAFTAHVNVSLTDKCYCLACEIERENNP